jgi:hypothetical protein
VKQPREQSEYLGRFGDCERAVGREVMMLVARALEAGWGEREVFVAVADRAIEYLQQVSIQDGHGTVLLPDTEREVASIPEVLNGEVFAADRQGQLLNRINARD